MDLKGSQPLGAGRGLDLEYGLVVHILAVTVSQQAQAGAAEEFG
jgi:hypothetical protein